MAEVAAKQRKHKMSRLEKKNLDYHIKCNTAPKKGKTLRALCVRMKLPHTN